MTPRLLPIGLALSAAIAITPATAQQPTDATAVVRPTAKPPLPLPPVDASSAACLLAARAAIADNRWDEAREMLEQAETRLLNRSVLAAAAIIPDRQHTVLDIGTARRAVADGNRPAALGAIDDALRALQAPSPPPVHTTPAPAIVPAFPPPVPLAAPPVTDALLPGHWQLDGARSVWVPPETTPRRVVDTTIVPNQYVWRDGRWMFVPWHTVIP